MSGGLEWGKHSDRSANGHELTTKFLAGYTLESAIDAGGREVADREATRYLAAATQLDVGYARSVVDRVVHERLRALAPNFGVNVEVVARWAMRAVRIRATRDYFLATILALQCFFIVVLILWWRWAWTLLLLLVAAAWLVTSWDYHERIHNTVVKKMLRSRFNLDEAPPPPRQADRERLLAIAGRRDGNLVVFSGHSAFIGSGELVSRRRLLLDISGKKEGEGGQARQPEEFTSHDLHAAILAAFGRQHGLGKSLDNISAYERLFVNGLHIQNDTQLLPDRMQAPPVSVDNSLLEAAAINPSPEGRTYVCVEMPGWQGQLVVTLFIRTVYAGKSLYVEWAFRVLPPIRSEFLGVDALYELPGYLQLGNSLAAGLRGLVPALLGSPIQALRSWYHPRAAEYARARNLHAIERGYVFDYGARRSIREDASGSQRQHYFLARDETMYVLLAQQTLIRTVGDFLDDHGIDLGQFKDQVRIIVMQSMNYNIGNITGSSGIVIGENSSATVGPPPKGEK
jgi:hypothetical protein